MAIAKRPEASKLQRPERVRRMRAVRGAVNSVRMEGLRVDAATSRVAREFLAGKITAAEMVRRVKSRFVQS